MRRKVKKDVFINSVKGGYIIEHHIGKGKNKKILIYDITCRQMGQDGKRLKAGKVLKPFEMEEDAERYAYQFNNG